MSRARKPEVASAPSAYVYRGPGTRKVKVLNAAGVPTGGTVATVVGAVVRLTEEERDAWVASGAILTPAEPDAEASDV